MQKESQSLIDFIDIMPRSGYVGSSSVLDNKESEALYNIWKNSRDKHGNIIIPEGIDRSLVARLVSKNFLKNERFTRASYDSLTSGTVEITEKGKNIIKNIILSKEKSAFEKESSFKINTLTKTASIKESSWLKRVFEKWN